MKKKLGIVGGLLALGLANFSASAFVIFQDNFPYPAGIIDAVTGGIWCAPPGSPTYGTTADISLTGNNSVNLAGTSTTDQPWAFFTNGLAGSKFPNPKQIDSSYTNGNPIYYFPSNAPVAALYASYVINVPNVSGNIITNTYIAAFTDSAFDYRCRMFVVTNSASAGAYRMAVTPFSTPSVPTNGVNIVQQDLSPGVDYTIVVKYVLSSGQVTMWINPATEATGGLTPTGPASVGGPSISDVSGTVTTTNFSTCAFVLRNHIGGGPLNISSLVIGTTFADVVPASAGANPPFLGAQPQNQTNFANSTVTFSAVAGGDAPQTYQWYYSVVGGLTIPIPGANSNVLTLANITDANQGGYFVAITNDVGGVLSSTATLTVIDSLAAPSIDTQPASTTVTLQGSTTFSVAASDGGGPLGYQWYFNGSAIVGETAASLPLSGITFAQAGPYYVVVSNANGTTQSVSVTLTVNPPASVTIAYLRSTASPTNFTPTNTTSLFTAQGVVTTWHDLTTAGNSEFFIQDATGGIAVFWSGAPAATFLPAAGSIVTITAPLSVFNGLLELAPVKANAFHSVSVVGTTNLPAPIPLVFDPNVIGNPTNMVTHFQGSYFVASNVFLDLGDGPNFGSGANDPITNGYASDMSYSVNLFTATNTTKGTNSTLNFTNTSGETFTIFYNAQCDYIGQPKPTGPLTIYGVMGQFVSSTPYTSGYEFTASRLADFVPALVFTNVISNVIRHGDLAVNTFSANVLQPGESLTMTVVASDPGGGTTTLSGLTGSGTWSAVTGNGTATASATYTYAATSANGGSADLPGLQAIFSSSGISSQYAWSIYVPTSDEQSVRIAEVFAGPTTNTNSPAYNPLQRPLPATSSTAANDQYVEIANLSVDPVPINRWTIKSGSTTAQQFLNGEQLPAGSSAVVYGGPLNGDADGPNSVLAFYVEAASPGPLSLSTAGGTVSLFNNQGNLIDRVVYPAGSTNRPGSFSRFPTLNDSLVPQVWISTNAVTPGRQYDGGAWSSPTKVPAGVTGVSITGGNPVVLNFTTSISQATTLWEANEILSPFTVVGGQQFPTGTGSFSITNPPAAGQFYFITTQ